MKVLIKNPGLKPEVAEIENELRALQKIVGGYVEVVPITDSIVLVCNEEGKIKNLPLNFKTEFDYICGTVIFASTSGEDLGSLSDEQIAEINCNFKSSYRWK